MNSILKNYILKILLSSIIFFSISLLILTLSIFDSTKPILQQFFGNLSIFPLVLLGIIIEPLYKELSNKKLIKFFIFIIFIVFIILYYFLVYKISFLANI